MVKGQILKDIIISNEEFILHRIKDIAQREEIHIPEALNKIVVFYGVRRSGKTFILFDLFKKYKGRCLYIDFEDERLPEFQVRDFETLKNAFLELKPELLNKESVFLLDEVQNIEGWEKFCRRVVEREGIKVFVSGSSSRMMPFEIHTELRGRAWSIEVLPFSFREFLSVRGIDAGSKSLMHGKKNIIVKNHFSEYLRWGGFPETSLAVSEFEKTKLLKEYFSAMFFRDIVERYKTTNISLMESLSDKLFSSFSTKLSLQSFYRQYKDKFPLSKDMLFKYYRHFLQSMLVFEVRKFSKSSYKRMRNPAKIYLVDTGLCRRVTSADTGRLLENMVFLELRRRNCEVFYFEEKKECDFIAKAEDGRLTAIQVSLEVNEQNTKREIDGLVAACRQLGITEGSIITYDEQDDLKAEGINIHITPAWKWATGN